MANRTKLAVILHADVVGSTALVQRDERVAHDRIRDVFASLSETVSSYGGRTHELRGDALVAEFQRASDAVGAGLSFQRTNASRSGPSSGEIRPAIRVGIALGEVVVADGTVTGAGVVLAQRLEQVAAAGGVVVQGAVAEAVPARLPFRFEFLGERALKGFEKRIRAYRAFVPDDATVPSPEPLEDGDPRSVEAASRRISVAVLPFENKSGDDEHYLADGIVEDLITALSRFRWFLVVARSSTLAYQDAHVDVREIGRELGARYVVKGSVRGSGTRVRVSVELVDVETGNQLWAERYDRRVEDLFELQDELTQTIAGELVPELSTVELNRARLAPPGSLAAWERYQRALWHMRKSTREDSEEACRWATSALALDPDFAPALSVRAFASLLSVIVGGAGDSERIVRGAIRDARAAVAIDNRDAFARFVLGRAMSNAGHHESAVEQLQQAIRLNPSLHEAYWGLGLTLQWWGKAEDSIPPLRRAIALSPHGRPGGTALCMLGIAYLHLRHYERAVDCLEQAIARGSDWVWSHACLAAAHAWLGHRDEASEALTAALAKEPRLSLRWVDKAAHRLNREYLDHLLEGLRKAGLAE